jgi:hypothetical protein
MSSVLMALAVMAGSLLLVVWVLAPRWVLSEQERQRQQLARLDYERERSRQYD